jgi:sugar phosphate isomerase/epimerase
MKRREFLTQSLAAVAGGAMLPSFGNEARSRQDPRGKGPASPAVRLGGPIFTEAADPVEMARAHRRLGYGAAYCPKADVKDTVTVRAIGDAFRKEKVVIAEVGRWVNLLDADAAKRRANLETVIEGLALAEAVGALCCVDIAGSFNPDVWYGPHPDNLSDRFLAVRRESADFRRRLVEVHGDAWA